MNKFYIFLLLNFIIGFVSDILLNKLSYYNVLNINTLRPYFEDKTILVAALYAGITVLIIAIIISLIYNYFNNDCLPKNRNQYINYLIITFIVSYLSDILIHKLNIFPKLQLYYDIVGSGLWGAIAILFSIILSLFIINKL